MFTPKRPHAGEIEDDLLEQQNEFIRAKNAGCTTLNSSSAKVTRVQSGLQESISSLRGTTASVTTISTESTSNPKRHSKENEFQFFQNEMLDSHISIKEKASEEVASPILKTFDLTPRLPVSIFQNIRVDKPFIDKFKKTKSDPKGTPSEKRQSLFSRSAEQRRSNKNVGGIESSEVVKIETEIIELQAGQSSHSVKSVEIKAEPETLFDIEFGEDPFAGMSSEEILAESNTLRGKLDPKMLEFIRVRSDQKQKLGPAKLKEEVPEPPVGVERVGNTVENISASLQQLPIDPEKVKCFPHMDKIESNKLAWTMNPPRTGAQGVSSFSTEQLAMREEETGTGLNARFDFKGNLISENRIKSEETWMQGLHNHGEEMDRPGYTIEELLTLARSINHQQRSIAFDTLTAIFENTQFGMFDFTLDKSLFYLWAEMDCIYVIRKGLDQSDPLTLNSALGCLAAMLYSLQEEMSLDTSYIWPNTTHPWIFTIHGKCKVQPMPGFPLIENSETDEKDKEDPEVCELDLIEFLVTRSALLYRLDYIMTKKSEALNEGGTLSILKILIRIARHSPDVIMEFEGLLKYIARNHLNSNWTLVGKLPKSLVGVPLGLALKFFRILADSSLRNARLLFSKLEILPAVLSYLAFDQWMEQNHVKDIEFLVLESLKIWKSFLSYGIGLDYYSSFFPILMKYLHAFGRREILNPFDLNHAAHIFSLLTEILNLSVDSHSHWPIVKDGVDFVFLFAVKLLAQLSEPHTASLCDFDFSLAALEQALELISVSRKHKKSHSVTNAIRKFVVSSGYSTITSELISHSLILMKSSNENSEKEKLKYPDNIAVCGATIFGGRLNPLLRQRTPFSFLTTLTRFVKTCHPESPELPIRLINSSVTKYFNRLVSRLVTKDSHILGDNFFLRYELNYLAESLEIQSNFQNFEFINKLIPLVQKCDTDLFGKLLHLCLKALGTQEKLVKSCLDAAGVFLKVLLTEDNQRSKRATDMRLKKWEGKIVKSRHWILDPFQIWYDFYINLESESQSIYTSQLLSGIRLVLQLVIFVMERATGKENVLISNAKDIVLFYSKISLCYLMGYELFLDTEIRGLLASILKKLGENPILRDHGKVVFLKLCNNSLRPSEFETLYSKLIGEFGSSSFGDEVFAGYILLPLRFGEGPNLKLKFMTGDITRYIRLMEEKSILPLDYFVGVKEKDPNVLAAFVAALKSGEVTDDRQPFLYNILRFHVLG